MTFVPNLDAPNLAIAKGNFTGIERQINFGRVVDMAPADGELMIRTGKFGNNLPNNAADISITSTDAADSATGTGVSTVRLVYLDNNWEVQESFVQMTGITPVVVAISLRRVITLSGIVSGSASAYNGGTPVGEINLLHDPSGTPVDLGCIQAGTGAFLGAIYTVPAGRRAIVDRVSVATEGTSKEADFFFNVRPNLLVPASPYFSIVKTAIASEVSSFRTLDSITNRFVVGEFTDLWLTATVAQPNTTVEAVITVYEELVP